MGIIPEKLVKSANAMVFLPSTVVGVKVRFVPSYSIAPATGVVRFTPVEKIKGAIVAVPAFICNEDKGVGTPIPIFPLFKTLNKLGCAVVLRPKVNVPKSIVVLTNSGLVPPSLVLAVAPVPVEVRPLVNVCACAVNIPAQKVNRKNNLLCFSCYILSNFLKNGVGNYMYC
jgi:hypothetical protein